MKLEFLFLGKTKEAYLAAGIEDFKNRLQHYAQLEIKTLKNTRPQKSASVKKIIKQEGEKLLAAKNKNSLLVALDREGRQLASEELAGLVDSWEGLGKKRVTFVVGGPLGLSEALLKQADLILSFSKMTFTHDMTRLLLLEQLYRAYTIKAGEQYHK